MSGRPLNIVMLLADQHRFDAVGVHGRTPCRTPHLDGLARSGCDFVQAITPCAQCSPARASLMTGRYPHNHGIWMNVHGPEPQVAHLRPDERTFSEILREAGYRLGYVGEWHVERDRLPTARGFHDYHPPPPMWRRETLSWGGALHLPLTGAPLYGVADETPEESQSAQLADLGLGLLREYAAGGQPFFLRVDWSHPHWPTILPEPYASLYDPEVIPPWPSFGDSFDGKPGGGKKLQQIWGLDTSDWTPWAEAVASYWGAVTLLDAQIGRVLAAIEELGLAETTLVAYTSDHGDFTGSHGLYNKGPLPYEELYRVPLLIRLPGGAAGARVEAPVVTFDLMPTFLEAAGLPAPDGLDARCLTPFLRGKAPAAWPAYRVAEYHGDAHGQYSQRIVRTPAHKLVLNVWDTDELYDLEADAAELRNEIDNPAYANVRRELYRDLLAWMRESGDTIRRWSEPYLTGRCDI